MVYSGVFYSTNNICPSTLKQFRKTRSLALFCAITSSTGSKTKMKSTTVSLCCESCRVKNLPPPPSSVPHEFGRLETVGISNAGHTTASYTGRECFIPGQALPRRTEDKKDQSDGKFPTFSSLFIPRLMPGNTFSITSFLLRQQLRRNWEPALRRRRGNWKVSGRVMDALYRRNS